ncbi:hypothetical protein HPB50_014915 [Hyalomma asiaticum]|uniref:Uncharacterized protein n=1 Tax=Hyalomma asiaticum TaxID=266040 RepID=A0ACB7SQJ6_HYAAI|nr:hypothetical protein HPB50_014915 [Hyalomma asiaticum]
MAGFPGVGRNSGGWCRLIASAFSHFTTRRQLFLVMVCLIMKSTSPLLVDSALILLQTVPTHIQIDSLQKKLLQEVEGVLAVHEFHVWQLAGERIIASAHIRCKNLQDYMQIAERVKEFFHNEGIHSTTIQPEFVQLEGQQFVVGYRVNIKNDNDLGSMPLNARCRLPFFGA